MNKYPFVDIAGSGIGFKSILPVLFLLTGCVSIPDSSEPVRQAAENSQWIEVAESRAEESGNGNSQTTTVSATIDTQWWELFGDPVLNTLIAEAALNSFDVRKAQAKLRETRAIKKQVRSTLWPSVNASAGYTWTEQSINSPSGPSSLIEAGFIDRDLEFWGAELAASWDLDLFGGNRFSDRSAKAQVEASKAALRGATLATVAEVAVTYIQYTSLVKRLEILNKNIAKQQASLDVLTKRWKVGLESRLNVDRASGLLAANQANVPQLTSQLRQTLYQLSVLTNQHVAELEALVAQAKPLLVPELMPTLGVKSDLLQRRPDIAAAEFQLHSASADIGRGKADLLPTLVIGATSGYSSGSTSNLFDSASRALALAPSLSMPVFNRGRLKAASDANIARYDYALAHYHSTVANAFADTEMRLVDLKASTQTAQLLDDAARLNAAASERAQKLYDRGLLSYLELLDAQRQQLVTEDAALQATATQQSVLVQLYVSLGGGWQAAETARMASPPSAH